MPDETSHSVTNWIEDLKAGDNEAAQKIWDRYFGRLIFVAAQRMRRAERRVADEEDVAISAFAALCDGAAAGRFDRLQNRGDLWSLLVAIASKKAVDQVRRQTSQKRGSGEVRGDSIFASVNGAANAGFEQIISSQPTPEFLALVDEEHSRLLAMLRDDVQRDVVGYRLAGYSNEETAEKIGISLHSVERKLKLIRDAWSRELQT